MATVKEVVTDALEEILEHQSEAPVEQADGLSVMRTLNDMLFMWDAKGVALGYTKVSNMGEELTVADGAIFGIKKLLAISIAPRFNAEISQALVSDAKDGWKAILSLTQQDMSMSYPTILPLGSGNFIYGTGSRVHFYPEVAKLF